MAKKNAGGSLGIETWLLKEKGVIFWREKTAGGSLGIEAWLLKDRHPYFGKTPTIFYTEAIEYPYLGRGKTQDALFLARKKPLREWAPQSLIFEA